MKATFGGDSVYHPNSINRHHLASAQQHLKLVHRRSVEVKELKNSMYRQTFNTLNNDGPEEDSFTQSNDGNVQVINAIEVKQDERPKTSNIVSKQKNPINQDFFTATT